MTQMPFRYEFWCLRSEKPCVLNTCHIKSSGKHYSRCGKPSEIFMYKVKRLFAVNVAECGVKIMRHIYSHYEKTIENNIYAVENHWIQREKSLKT